MNDEPDPPTAPSRVTVRDVFAIIGMVFQAAFVLAMSMNVAGGGRRAPDPRGQYTPGRRSRLNGRT